MSHAHTTTRPTSTAIQVIREEHRNLWRIATTLSLVADEIAQDAKVDAAFFDALFDYLGQYVDHAHHPKEDEHLFKLLRTRDADLACVLDALTLDHRSGPAQLAVLRALVHTPDSAVPLVMALRDYADGLHAHIRMEETRVLPVAENILTEEDWRHIDQAFALNDDPLFGEAGRVQFRELYHRIASLAPASVGLGEQAEPLLRVKDVESHYGRIQALRGISMDIRKGELVALVGANGAGKTTFLRTLSGVQPLSGGHIRFEGEDIGRLRADKRVQRGIAHSPEGRQVFGPLSIEDNLRLGGYTRTAAQAAEDLERVYGMFPVLKEKRLLPAGTLSGGQQQMLAIGRALMARPKLLLLDEPSMGLAPLLVEEVFNVIKTLKAQGMTILLVEQNAFAALAIADRAYVVETGTIVLSGTGANLLRNEQVRAAYLGM